MLRSREGQIVIGAAVLDDILGIVILAVVVALAGQATQNPARLPLVYQTQTVGDLLVGHRTPGEAFGPADRRLNHLLVQAGVGATVYGRWSTWQSRTRMTRIHGHGLYAHLCTELGVPLTGEAALHRDGETGQIGWRGPQSGSRLLRIDAQLMTPEGEIKIAILGCKGSQASFDLLILSMV